MFSPCLTLLITTKTFCNVFYCFQNTYPKGTSVNYGGNTACTIICSTRLSFPLFLLLKIAYLYSLKISIQSPVNCLGSKIPWTRSKWPCWLFLHAIHGIVPSVRHTNYEVILFIQHKLGKAIFCQAALCKLIE